MTTDEFRTFKRAIAFNAVKYELGKITAEELCDSLYVTLGKDIFAETKEMLKEREREEENS